MRRLRHLVVVFSAALLCSSLVALGGAGTAVARADCNQADPIADVSIAETISSSTVTNPNNSVTTLYTIHAIATNFGPCNVPDASITITLPAGGVFDSVSSLPTSWNCTGVGTSVEACPAPGAGSPTIGVPGNHDFFGTFHFATAPAGDSTIVTSATVGGPSGGCGDGNAQSTCDPYTDNNTIWALANGGSLTTCSGHPTGNGGNTSGCGGSKQFADYSSNAGTAALEQLQSRIDAANQCSNLTGFPKCFGKIVSLTANGASLASPATLTITIDASLARTSFGNVQLIRTTDGTTWSSVPTCRSHPLSATTTACVLSKTQFKIGGVTYWQFVTLKSSDDSWGLS